MAEVWWAESCPLGHECSAESWARAKKKVWSGESEDIVGTGFRTSTSTTPMRALVRQRGHLPHRRGNGREGGVTPMMSDEKRFHATRAAMCSVEQSWWHSRYRDMCCICAMLPECLTITTVIDLLT